jgi:hypothetical protein
VNWIPFYSLKVVCLIPISYMGWLWLSPFCKYSNWSTERANSLPTVTQQSRDTIGVQGYAVRFQRPLAHLHPFWVCSVTACAASSMLSQRLHGSMILSVNPSIFFPTLMQTGSPPLESGLKSKRHYAKTDLGWVLDTWKYLLNIKNGRRVPEENVIKRW